MEHHLIFIAGHKGIVGSAIKKTFIKNGYTNILTASRNEVAKNNINNKGIFFLSSKRSEKIFFKYNLIKI